MKKTIILLILTISLFSCAVKETIVFNEDGSGKFLVSYDMSEMMTQMKEQMGGSSSKEQKAMDTTMVFSEIMEEHKDSIAALPEEQREIIEALKGMYMTMKVDEEEGMFNMGIGLDFDNYKDLKGIGEKIKKAKSLNDKGGQMNAMKGGSPIGKFMGDDEKNNVEYMFTDKSFSRITHVDETVETEKEKVGEGEGDEEFMEYFEDAVYVVEYTFPKKIKSVSVKDAKLSKDKKTVTYTVNWVDFINDPKALDFNLKFK